MLLDNKICKISNYVRALNDLIKDMEQNGFSKSAMMLKEAKKALYVELHEVLKAELTPREEPKNVEEERSEEAGNGKEPIIWITDSVGYYYDGKNCEYVLVRKKPCGIFTLRKFKRAVLEKIWNDLPEKATATDLTVVAKKHGVKLGSHVSYVMRIFCHVHFDGSIERDGRKIVLVKPYDYSLAEDFRRQLDVEKEIIGGAYSLSGGDGYAEEA